MKNQLMRHPSKAFTLTEILCTMAVLAVLAALLLPMIGSAIQRSQQASCVAHMRQVGALVLQYSAEHNGRCLPVVSGPDHNMWAEPWYYILDVEGYLPGNPNNPNNKGKALWGGSMKSIMACPARPDPPNPYWTKNKHDLHFAINQNPGFLNRVNTVAGPWPTVMVVKNPGRTFLLAETNTYITDHGGTSYVYPHPRKGSAPGNGQGMNLFFYDGHSEFYQGQLPKLPGGNYLTVPYDQTPPEKSFPHF